VGTANEGWLLLGQIFFLCEVFTGAVTMLVVKWSFSSKDSMVVNAGLSPHCYPHSLSSRFGQAVIARANDLASSADDDTKLVWSREIGW
jgi:hypothetical protein